MSTMLEDRGECVAVSTVTGPGGQRRMARGTVLVPKDKPDLIKAAMLRQALAVRAQWKIQTAKQLPVV